MDIVTTSLEALIQRATCNQNQCLDTAAIDAFCGLVNKEPECAQTATRFITAKVHSLHEWEALQALHVLDMCMKRCGGNFHAEVGKFRFLNELIKLVSPKYAGAHTPDPVKRRVLELMQAWTVMYPREQKIKEAYEMLKKQGVVKEEPLRPVPDVQPPPPPRHQDSIFQDMEKSRLLQKLLQSKNPDDLQAANRLIKTMVKEDERRVEMKSRHLSELEAAHNNARLLSEMLDSYSREVSSPQDLELINELHSSCLRYRPNVQKLLSEVHNDERLFNEVLAANDELGEVIDKHSAVIVQGGSAGGVKGSLLDLSSPTQPVQPTQPAQPHDTVNLLCDQINTLDLDVPMTSTDSVQLLSSAVAPPPPPQPLGDLSTLGDIFSSVAQPVSSSLIATHTPLKPEIPDKPMERKTGLEELDALSESLLRQSLPTVTQPPPRAPAKMSMNELSLSQQNSPLHVTPAIHSTPGLLDSVAFDLLSDGPSDLLTSEPPQLNGDACILDTSKPEPLLEIEQTPVKKTEENKTIEQPKEQIVVRSLGDVNVTLDSIKPGSLPPLTVVEERGISVKIHFGRDSPRPDVSVFVVTTTSSSQFPVTDYLFQAIVPKGCKLKLQPPSSTELPAHNPFLPPAAITQVMLIASSTREPILLRVVVSFNMDDETVTEMKEIESFSLSSS
ncbi:ADP-ribosylation factor-binding protein GGA1-like [Macrosteles quadrilineatus]|uniref:ADP-ribosylation factor-binding protein GGA1-like n=1 Tax=Macrosteles quadrilineatus TaxID=74068 RepID=UPI0023E34628|nr:ADP-ribosylation factor-binding protein GGA1-like [Macrosteles quadrilineatus]